MHTEYINPDSEIILITGSCLLAASSGLDVQTSDMIGEEGSFLD